MRLLAVAVALAAGLDWWAVATARRPVERWAKPATMLAMIALAVGLGAPDSASGHWLLGALALGTLGDVLLLGGAPSRFLGGLAAFLVGHLSYVACFLALGVTEPGWAGIGVLLLAVSLAASRAVLPSAWHEGGAMLAGPVGLYMAVIGAMLVTGWTTGRLLVGVGAAVFVASDTMLALDRLVAPRRWAGVSVMVTYHLGQALIVLGVLGRGWS
ncbi:MAG: lysoplasmalogenase [Kineosporiaceae bacterium]